MKKKTLDFLIDHNRFYHGRKLYSDETLKEIAHSDLHDILSDNASKFIKVKYFIDIKKEFCKKNE